MLQSKAKWKDIEQPETEELIQDIPLEISPVVEKLLLQRGIRNTSEAKSFLTPDIENLHHPKNLKDIDIAADRIHQAIEKEEKILVYGDYDADGVTSTTVLMKALNELNAICDFYIPNRFSEGYGLNEDAIYYAKDQSVSLIITVDTGITAIHEANVAKALGIDLIITDHHEPQGELPNVTAIIHPQLSEAYPFKDLAGVGVAFKLAEYLLGYFPKHLLEYVAIGTIADLVSLKDENRILTYYGLDALTVSKSPGIQSLKNICKIEGKVTEESIGFMIGPRLNAVGRLQDASLAVQLLLTDSLDEAKYLAEEVDLINQERQRIVSEIILEAEAMVDPKAKDVIIVSKANWNEGVLGIVASRLVQKFDRPAIVLNVNEEKAILKGSARSIPAFDLFTNCMKIRDLFINFGGHAQAAGMTIEIDKIAKIQSALNTYLSEEVAPEDFKQEILVSGTITLPEVNEKLVDEINQLAPYGMGNPKPIFKLSHIPSDIRQIGGNKNHLKLQFAEEGKTLDGIAFGLGKQYHQISPNTELSLVGELNINEWNGNRKAQIMVQDIRIDEWQLFDYRGRKNYQLDHLPQDDTIFVSNTEAREYPNYAYISYDADFSELKKYQNIVLYELPTKTKNLIEILNESQPKNIYACYHINDSAYLTSFPSRDDFVWFYANVMKQEKVDMKTEIHAMMKLKSWSRDKIIFIVQVFKELGFINTNNGVVEINPDSTKKDLEESTIYQDRLHQQEIEKQLYYSSYPEFRNWFETNVDYLGVPKEEKLNGF
ncbi:single-stranded-DNA-specific exonuclease RecJ [Oceanobacillus sp. CAU 1775]